MKSHAIWDCGLLAAAVALSRAGFRSRYLYDVDSVHFAQALEKFDPALFQPHPPGYYLYVWAGRLAAAVFSDPNTALVALSIVASCVAAVATYALAHAWYGRRAAVFAGLIFLLSPLSWFHGIVALTYVVEAGAAAVVGYLCWQTYSGRPGFAVPSAVALGLAAGFRQSTIVFLGPLWLLSLLRVRRRGEVWAGCAALGLTTLAWLLPMVLESGGVERYSAVLYLLWSAVPAQKAVFAYPLGQAVALLVARALTILFIFALCFGSFALAPFLRRSPAAADGGKSLFITVWLLPGLLFFTLIYLLFVNSGYLLVLCPPLCAWLGSRLDAWCRESRLSRGSKAAAIASLAAVNVAIFLYAPLYCSYSSVRRFEAELESVRAIVRARFRPSDTILVGFDSHFLGFRHSAYYLPEYLTLGYPAASLPEGKRLFAFTGGQTRLLSELPQASQRTFLLFPLPEGASYREYLERISAKFPDHALRSERAGGRELQVGSVSDLQYLFPVPAEQAAVSTDVNTWP